MHLSANAAACYDVPIMIGLLNSFPTNEIAAALTTETAMRSILLIGTLVASHLWLTDSVILVRFCSRLLNKPITSILTDALAVNGKPMNRARTLSQSL